MVGGYMGETQRGSRCIVPGIMTRIVALFDSLARYRALERTTLTYIAVPFLVFAMGWLRPIVERTVDRSVYNGEDAWN
jgi:hypothetical protein